MKAPQDIEVIVRAVCVVDGHLLLCRRIGAPRSYLPGGHVEPGESAREALRRELREELGIQSELGPFCGAVEHRFLDDEGVPTHELNLLFETRLQGIKPPEPPRSMEPRIRFEWCALDALPSSDLQPWPLRCELMRWMRAAALGWASTLEAEEGVS